MTAEMPLQSFANDLAGSVGVASFQGFADLVIEWAACVLRLADEEDAVREILDFCAERENERYYEAALECAAGPLAVMRSINWNSFREQTVNIHDTASPDQAVWIEAIWRLLWGAEHIQRFPDSMIGDLVPGEVQAPTQTRQHTQLGEGGILIGESDSATLYRLRLTAVLLNHLGPDLLPNDNNLSNEYQENRKHIEYFLRGPSASGSEHVSFYLSSYDVVSRAPLSEEHLVLNHLISSKQVLKSIAESYAPIQKKGEMIGLCDYYIEQERIEYPRSSQHSVLTKFRRFLSRMARMISPPQGSSDHLAVIPDTVVAHDRSSWKLHKPVSKGHKPAMIRLWRHTRQAGHLTNLDLVKLTIAQRGDQTDYDITFRIEGDGQVFEETFNWLDFPRFNRASGTPAQIGLARKTGSNTMKMFDLLLDLADSGDLTEFSGEYKNPINQLNTYLNILLKTQALAFVKRKKGEIILPDDQPLEIELA